MPAVLVTGPNATETGLAVSSPAVAYTIVIQKSELKQEYAMKNKVGFSMSTTRTSYQFSNYSEPEGARPLCSAAGPLGFRKIGLKGAWFGPNCCLLFHL